MTSGGAHLPEPVARPCPACGAPVVGVERCGTCGSPAGEPRRRVVTLLFADLTGYTALCAALDPEDVHLLVRPLMNGLRRVCEELGGAVPGIEGDGFMAVFGATRSSADDPLRAVTAAQRMHEVMQQRRAAYGDGLPELRVGLHVGEVLVAPSWEATGFSLSGDAVNVASRLCGLAPEGGVLASSQLVDALGSAPRWLSWSDGEDGVVRNRERPVRTHVLRAVAPEAGSRTDSSPLVGRSDELDLLSGAHAAVVTGEAGVGKSRLVEAWAAQSGHRVLRTACPSFTSQGSLQVLAELARPFRAHLRDLVGPTTARRLSRLLGSAVDSHEVDSAAEQARSVADLLVGASEVEPLAVVVEDVHWASPEVTDALEVLLAAATDRLRVVVTGRDTSLDAPGALALTLQPLGPAAVDALVRHLLPGADDVLVQSLRERTGRLPLYVEQCVRLLVEEGSVALTAEGSRLVAPDGLRRVPTSMRLFVAARLELLEDAERAVLDAAAVAGDTVQPDLLRHLARHDVADEVEALVVRGLLEWAPDEGGPQLRFRHAVVRDVVYEGQLLARRVETHRNAAEWFSVRLPRQALLGRARHLEAALGLLTGRGAADCQLVSDASRALALLAHSILIEDPQGAADAAERGLAIVDAHPECGADRLDLDILLAEAYEELGRNDDAVTPAERALAAADAARDDLGSARACLALARIEWDRDAERARALLDRSAELFTARDDWVGSAAVEVQRARFDHFDELGSFLAAHERAFRAAELGGDARWSSYMSQLLAVHCQVEGRAHLDTWKALSVETMRLSDTAGRGRLVLADGVCELHAHELERAVALLRQAHDQGREAGVRHTQVNAAVHGLEAAACAGLLDEAARFADDIQVLLASRTTEMLSLNDLVFRPLLLSRLGRREEADALHAEAEERLRDATDKRLFVRDLRAAQARVAFDRGDLARARTLSAEAVQANRAAGEHFLGLRLRLLQMATWTSLRVPLFESIPLGREARERGAPAINALAHRWLELDDLLRGEMPIVRVQLPELPSGTEALALDHEVRSFLDLEPERLLAAADAWRGLGVTHFPARSLLWYAAITGDESRTAEARDVLAECGAPEGLEAELRAQPEPPRVGPAYPRRT